jgi:ribose-phosphate pyrophosphokinase
MIKLNGHVITPTIFPDKTSQVWKLPDDYFNPRVNTITWEFENEAEFMHVAQLKYLLDFTQDEDSYKFLKLPYLPYARQDKLVSNSATFALMPFFTLLNTLDFDGVDVFDPHNVELVKKCIDGVFIEMPDPDPLLAELNANIVFPDAGAAKRYDGDSYLFAVVCDKDRDPLTGKINGVVISRGTVIAESYLIVDDICDGGRTFIEVAKKLYEAGAKEVHLYVSHGIFSKGLDVLRDAGIKRIFTKNGEVK